MLSPERYKELLTMPYEDYLQSPEWQERRRRALEWAWHRCQVCYSDEQLEVHHRSYERRGNELDSDLTVLCHACHERHHSIPLSTSTTALSAGDIMERCVERFPDTIDQKSSIIGIPSGFRDLDSLIHGFRQHSLYILASRPMLGKTSLALAMADNMASRGKKVAVFSLEMSTEELGFRLISARVGIPADRIRAGFIEDDEMEKIGEAMATISANSLMIDDTGGLEIGQLRARCRNLKASTGLDVVIVDYLQLMHATINGKCMENRVQEIGAITRGLKELAKELDVPVIALSQLSRDVEKRSSKVPQLSDLRESGDIEADADVVLFIYRDEVYNPETERCHLADIIAAKNRHGIVGEITLFFTAYCTRFSDLVEVELTR